MKLHVSLPLLFLFFISALALPAPPDKSNKQPDKGKGKGKALPSPPPPSLEPPLPGRSGVHTENRISTAYYGDDRLPGHMRHNDRNQKKFPQNKGDFGLAHMSDSNRKNALKGIDSGKIHPVTGERLDRDEKPPNMFHVPDRNQRTTVEYRLKSESRGKNSEGVLLGDLRIPMKDQGTRGRLVSNPGWRPLDPNQQRAHSSNPSLPSNSLYQSGIRPNPTDDQRRPPSPMGNYLAPRPPWIKSSDPNTPAQPPKSAPANKKPSSSSQKQPKLPPPAHEMPLRPRPTVPGAPPKTPQPPQQKRPPGGPSFLSKGTPAKPAGHVWRPTNNDGKPALSGPPRPANQQNRQPPRPQNRDAFNRQQNQAQPRPPPPTDRHPSQPRPQSAPPRLPTGQTSSSRIPRPVNPPSGARPRPEDRRPPSRGPSSPGPSAPGSSGPSTQPQPPQTPADRRLPPASQNAPAKPQQKPAKSPSEPSNKKPSGGGSKKGGKKG